MFSEEQKWKERCENERRARLEAEQLLSDRLRTLYGVKQDLEAANRELDAFAYSVSHDLRSPLRAVNGYARILLEEQGGRLDAEGRRLLAALVSGAEKMARLIEDLLEFSRLGRAPLQASSVDAAALAGEVLRDLLSAAPQRSIETEIGMLPPAWGDPALLRQVFANLIGNAVKYTRTREAARIEIGGRSDARETTYWVKDNGVGFDMAYASKLFGVFQRLHSVGEFEGTGVGLALVQRIIQRHRGRVWAEAAVDRGATFWFTLPNGDVATS